MRYRVLGRTGVEVSELGLGGLFLASFAAEREEARRVVHRAVELGINYIDTAPGYYDSEAAVGYAMAGVNAPLILSTKLGGRPLPFDPQDKDALRRSVEESLQTLQRDRIDILFIHEPDRPGQYNWFTIRQRFYGPVCELLEELKAEGLIRFTGLGGTTVYEMAQIIATGSYDVVLTAFNYSLLWREAAAEIFPAAKKQNMGIILGSPLQQGALARRYDEEVNGGARWLSAPRRRQFQRLYALLDEVGITLPELGLRFAISNPDISTVLMGARSAAEVAANVRAVAAGPLPPDLLAELQSIADMVPFRPFEEPFSLPFGQPEPLRPGMAH